MEQYRGNIRAASKLCRTDIRLLIERYRASVYDNCVTQPYGVYDHSVPQDGGVYDHSVLQNGDLVGWVGKVSMSNPLLLRV